MRHAVAGAHSAGLGRASAGGRRPRSQTASNQSGKQPSTPSPSTAGESRDGRRAGAPGTWIHAIVLTCQQSSLEMKPKPANVDRYQGERTAVRRTQNLAAKQAQRERDAAAGYVPCQIKLPRSMAEKLRAALQMPGFENALEGFSIIP